MRINSAPKRKFVFLTILCIFFLLLSITIEAADLKVRVLVDNANVRLKADSTSPVIGSVPGGTILESEGLFGEWYQVKLPPNEEGFVVTGFIHQQLVEALGETKEFQEATKKDKEIPVEQPRPTQKPEVPKSAVSQYKFYLKGTLGFGVGFEKISSGFEKIYEGDRESEEIFIYPGGGINIEGGFGYLIIPALKAELGIGYQASGTSAEDDKVSFYRGVLTLSLIYEFQSKSSIHFYIGAGPGMYFSPAYTAEVGSSRAEITYDPSFGLHGLAGIVSQKEGKPLFYFGEIRLAGLIKYNWNKATFVNYPSYITSNFLEMSGNGVFINFGIGYAF